MNLDVKILTKIFGTKLQPQQFHNSQFLYQFKNAPTIIYNFNFNKQVSFVAKF